MATKTQTIEVEMTVAKETKNTFRFEAPDEAIDTLYIQKSAFGGERPSAIKVTVEVQ